MVSPNAAANRDVVSECIRVYPSLSESFRVCPSLSESVRVCPSLSAGDAVSESICKAADPEAATDSDVDRLGCIRVYRQASRADAEAARVTAYAALCCLRGRPRHPSRLSWRKLRRAAVMPPGCQRRLRPCGRAHPEPGPADRGVGIPTGHRRQACMRACIPTGDRRVSPPRHADSHAASIYRQATAGAAAPPSTRRAAHPPRCRGAARWGRRG